AKDISLRRYISRNDISKGNAMFGHKHYQHNECGGWKMAGRGRGFGGPFGGRGGRGGPFGRHGDGPFGGRGRTNVRQRRIAAGRSGPYRGRAAPRLRHHQGAGGEIPRRV
ncbi:MAG: hypothetical protein QM744_02425, partial [Mesorhizobium sp.]